MNAPSTMTRERLAFANGRCRSCGAGIVWASTRAAKRIPMNPWATQYGDYVVTSRSPTSITVAKIPREADTTRLADQARFSSHFDTCKKDYTRRPTSAVPKARAHTEAYRNFASDPER